MRYDETCLERRSPPPEPPDKCQWMEYVMTAAIVLVFVFDIICVVPHVIKVTREKRAKITTAITKTERVIGGSQ
jgi:hypothetical protein